MLCLGLALAREATSYQGRVQVGWESLCIPVCACSYSTHTNVQLLPASSEPLLQSLGGILAE